MLLLLLHGFHRPKQFNFNICMTYVVGIHVMCVHVCFFIFFVPNCRCIKSSGDEYIMCVFIYKCFILFHPTLETYVRMTIIFGDSSKLSNY